MILKRDILSFAPDLTQASQLTIIKKFNLVLKKEEKYIYADAIRQCI